MDGVTEALPDPQDVLTGELYRTLLEQIPAVTFMTSFERGLQEVYVSPQIESILGYTQKEWLSSPSLWYQRLHSRRVGGAAPPRPPSPPASRHVAPAPRDHRRCAASSRSRPASDSRVARE